MAAQLLLQLIDSSENSPTRVGYSNTLDNEGLAIHIKIRNLQPSDFTMLTSVFGHLLSINSFIYHKECMPSISHYRHLYWNFLNDDIC